MIFRENYIIDKYDEEQFICSLTTNTDEVYLNCVDGEAEDNTLSRNFNDIVKLEEFVRAAYLAGQRGEEYTYVQREYNSDGELEIIDTLEEKGVQVDRKNYNDYIVTINGESTKMDYKSLDELCDKYMKNGTTNNM